FNEINAAQLSIIPDGVIQVNFTGVLKLEFVISFSCGQTTYLNLKTLLNGQPLNFINFDYMQSEKTVTLTLNVTAGDLISLEVNASDTGYYNDRGAQEPTNEPQEITVDDLYTINYSISL